MQCWSHLWVCRIFSLSLCSDKAAMEHFPAWERGRAAPSTLGAASRETRAADARGLCFSPLSATADGDGNLEEPRVHEQTKPAAYHGRIRATPYEDGPLSRAAAGKRGACCCPYQRSRAAEPAVGLILLPPAPGLSLTQRQSSEQRGHRRSISSKFFSFRKCV